MLILNRDGSRFVKDRDGHRYRISGREGEDWYELPREYDDDEECSVDGKEEVALSPDAGGNWSPGAACGPIEFVDVLPFDSDAYDHGENLYPRGEWPYGRGCCYEDPEGMFPDEQDGHDGYGHVLREHEEAEARMCGWSEDLDRLCDEHFANCPDDGDEFEEDDDLDVDSGMDDVSDMDMEMEVEVW